MVVATSETKLVVVRIDLFADWSESAQIEGCSTNGANFSSGYHRGVDRCKAVGRETNLLGENVAVRFAGKIEVAVVCQIDDGRVIGFCVVVDTKAIAGKL